jgi:hypothetical protein
VRTSFKHVLAAIGVLIFASALVGPRESVEAGLERDQAGQPAAVDRASVALVANETEMLGTWEITYSKVLRANQEGSLEVRYDAERSWLLERNPIELSATVGANSLRLSEPGTYAFDLERIKGAGADARSWIVTPTAEGDYNINVTLSAASDALDLEMRPVVMVNDEIRRGEHSFQLLLPVSVATHWGIAQWQFDLIRYALMGLGFILTLPFLQTAFGAIVAGRGRPPSGRNG